MFNPAAFAAVAAQAGQYHPDGAITWRRR